MGFLDKVKEQAAQATAVAKDAAQKGQAKLEDLQAKKGADGLLRDLGAAAYAQQTGRGTATTEADLERIVAALHAFEAEHGPIDLSVAPAGGAAPPPPPASGAPAATPAAAAPTAPPVATSGAAATAPPPPPTSGTL